MPTAAQKPVINLDDVPLFELKNGDAFEAKLGRVSKEIGSSGIGCMLNIVPPGKKAFPFHVHHVAHELFIVLEGEGEYRFGDETYAIKKGDVLAAPAGGPERAHQIINSGDNEMKYIAISDIPASDAEVVEYPDSNKFAVVSQTDDASPMTAKFRYIGRHDTNLDYWDGEN